MPGVGGNQERSTCRRTRARSTYKGTHTQHTQHTYKYDLHDAQAQAHAAHAHDAKAHAHAHDAKAHAAHAHDASTRARKSTRTRAEHAAHAAHAQARTPPLPSSSSFPAQPPLVASRRGLTSSPGKSSVVRGAAVAASRLARGECSVVRGARWVAHDVSWKWKWYLVIFLVLNRGEEMWAGRCRCGPRERGTALAVLYIEWHLTWMREWMRGLVRAPSSWRAVTLILIRCWLCLESSQRGRARSQSLLQMALLVRCWLSAGYQRVCVLGS